jgi:hypothetical protein
MLISSIYLIFAYVITFRRDKSLSFNRITSLILLYSTILGLTSLYVISFNTRIEIINGLFQITIFHIFVVFISILGIIIIQLSSIYPMAKYHVFYNKCLYYIKIIRRIFSLHADDHHFNCSWRYTPSNREFIPVIMRGNKVNLKSTYNYKLNTFLIHKCKFSTLPPFPHNKNVLFYDCDYTCGHDIIFNNFFDEIDVINHGGEYPYENNFWENTESYSSDLYNYMYKKFIWDFNLSIECVQLQPDIDFNYIFIVFSKLSIDHPMVKHDKKLSDFLKNDNILYYETISITDIKELVEKFVDAYGEGEFDDLHNSITYFCKHVIYNLEEIHSEHSILNLNNYNDIHLNLIIPDHKLESPLVHEKCLYSDIGNRF